MILLNDFKRQWEDQRESLQTAFETVGSSGWYILGSELRGFEEALARYWEMQYCVGVSSGLDAIELGLRILGCKAGDYVLTTPVSAYATTLAIIKLGAVPVFVDTDRYGLLDLDRCAHTLEQRPEISFLLPVHLYGNALNLDKLSALRARFGCRIVEDCAQSIGARFEGRNTGTVGGLAATSFYPTKNLGAMGDGGAILTNSSEHDARARVLRDYGQEGKYRHGENGYNSRLDELQAALLRRALLPALPGWTARRRHIAARYLSEICHPWVRGLGPPPGSDSCWHLFPVLVPPHKKSLFMSYLRNNEVSSGEHYPTPIPSQRALQGVAHLILDGCETANEICRSEVSLPIHPYLTEAEVSHVIEVVNAWGD
ncbi:MAG TPA: DegT/DnrJ/EryC1/StrS family aminotransferase [Bryobacteraceae bacterium]|nr:DegT/DnrJ/EryC1/StrS family aminotransferase [Bryobacteraceae bacterium]